jgi:enoyl reductase-like protein
MRASIYVSLDTCKVRNVGSDNTRFIAVELDDLTIFFDGYGQEHADKIYEFANRLIMASREMSSIIAQEKAVAEEQERLDFESYAIGERTGLEQHDTLEEHRGEK